MVQSIAPLSRALLLLPVLGVTAQAQATPAELIQNFRWRNIGPANMMGRIAAIDALDEDYRTVLMGSASGGVFKSTNAGTTWTPIFDRYGSGSIGDVAFFQPDPDIIWVATGESANRNSSGWGDGIYKSTDGGRTFQNMGLRDTAQIAEIAVHPSDPDIVYAAAIGHLWGYSGSRGLFKTTDGGETWAKLNRGLQLNGLPDDYMIGCIQAASVRAREDSTNSAPRSPDIGGIRDPTSSAVAAVRREGSSTRRSRSWPGCAADRRRNPAAARCGRPEAAAARPSAGERVARACGAPG